MIPSEYSFERYLSAKKSVDDRALNRHVWQRLTNGLPAGRPLQVLEVGAGIGTMVERMLDWGALRRSDYTAIDFMPENVAVARGRLARWGEEHRLRVSQPMPGRLLLEGAGVRLSVRLLTIDLFDFIREYAGDPAMGPARGSRLPGL